MKTLLLKKEITATRLKDAEIKGESINYRGHRIGKEGKYYFIGGHFHSGVYYFPTLKDLKNNI